MSIGGYKIRNKEEIHFITFAPQAIRSLPFFTSWPDSATQVRQNYSPCWRPRQRDKSQSNQRWRGRQH